MDSFRDKVVLVTGGSSGIGVASALRFARDGANIAVGARHAEQGDDVVRRIEAAGGRGLFIPTDVRKRADIEALVAATVARFGRLDYAINNAGVTGPIRVALADIDEDAWDDTMAVNLKGVFLSMKYEIPAMLKNGGGAIVNVASVFGLKPNNMGATVYGASKFGLIGLTQIAAIDYARQGIRINAVCPGFTHSAMVDPFLLYAPDLMRTALNHFTASGRVAEADEVADAIAFLCSHSARSMTGAALVVDGGDRARAW
jgi:NAD(P)-dependent dehydrogenase (short-subunit alcohol dehydrogenase family)